MSHSRLSTAIARGDLVLPEGRIIVLRPALTMDLSALPRERVTIVTTFRPDLDAWAEAGWSVSDGIPADVGPDSGPDAIADTTTALIAMPRSKSLARGLVAEAARMARLVIVDGDRTDGIDSLWRDLRARLGDDLPCVTRAHGRLFWFAPAGPIDDWALPAPQRDPTSGYVTRAGIFAEGGVDRGSALLAAALPATLPAGMADLGAGAGLLSRAVLARAGVQSLDLIEAERLALDCARLNVTDPRARFLWADATRHRPERAYDGIVMNPPFHRGRAADPDLGRAFIAAAAGMLTAGGQLWMVANRHLPYEAALRERFRNLDEIGGDGTFKLFHASRPQKPARR